jgi:hypothetical protein
MLPSPLPNKSPGRHLVSAMADPCVFRPVWANGMCFTMSMALMSLRAWLTTRFYGHVAVCTSVPFPKEVVECAGGGAQR